MIKNRPWHKNAKYPALMIDDRYAFSLPEVFQYVGIRWRTYYRVTAALCFLNIKSQRYGSPAIILNM